MQIDFCHNPAWDLQRKIEKKQNQHHDPNCGRDFEQFKGVTSSKLNRRSDSTKWNMQNIT